MTVRSVVLPDESEAKDARDKGRPLGIYGVEQGDF